MSCKLKHYAMAVILFATISCNKEDNGSDLTFSQTCNFSGSNTETVEKLTGSLSYTDNLSGHPFSNGGFRFVIQSPGRLPMVVCNIPSGFKIENGQSRAVTFSGRVVKFPDVVDAINTDIELNFLKFN